MPAVRMPNGVAVQYVGGLRLQEAKKKKPNNDILLNFHC